MAWIISGVHTVFGTVGGSVKPGIVYGETDEFSYNVVRDPITGMTGKRSWCTCSPSIMKNLHTDFKGRQFRLTDVRGEGFTDLIVEQAKFTTA